MCTYLGSVAYLACMYGIKFQSDVPAPSYYEMILDSLDGRVDLVTNIIVERNGETVDMHIEENIPPNSLWRASILAYGCESDTIVTNFELSKLERIKFGDRSGDKTRPSAELTILVYNTCRYP